MSAVESMLALQAQGGRPMAEMMASMRGRGMNEAGMQGYGRQDGHDARQDGRRRMSE